MGEETKSEEIVQQVANTEAVVAPVKVRERSFLAAFFFSFMWGILGVDRFYLGKYFTGVLKLLTAGGFGIWLIIDMGSILSGSMKDKWGNPLVDYDKYKKLARKTLAIFSFVSIIILIAFVVSIVFAVQMILAQFQVPPIDWQSMMKMFTDVFSSSSNLQQDIQSLKDIPTNINNIQF